MDNGGNATAAAQVVAKTLNDQWMPVDLNGKKVLLPRVGRTKDGARMVYDQQVLEHTLSVMSTEEAPKLAKQAGASNYQTAQFRIVAMPGGDTEVEVTDDVGNPIPGTARVPFTDLYKRIEAKYHDDAYKQAAAVKADAEYRRSHPKSTVLMGQAGRGA